MLFKIIENKCYYNLDNRYMQIEVMMNIGLKRIDIQKKSNSRSVVG